MAALTFNGWTIPCAKGSVSAPAPQGVGGESTESVNGKVRRGERGWIFRRDITTAPMLPVDCDALEGMLRGDFYHFPFDEGLESESAHLGPSNVGYSALLITASPTPKFGTYAVKVNASGGYLTYAMNRVRAGYFVSWWHNHNNSPANTWTHYLRTYNPYTAQHTVYTNNVVTYGPSSTPPTSPANVTATLSGGTLTVNLQGKNTAGTNSANANYDELVMGRFHAPAGLVAAIYNGGTGRVWSPEPYLDAAGDLLGGYGTVEVSGRVGQRSMEPMHDTDGTLYKAMARLSFNLQFRERA